MKKSDKNKCPGEDFMDSYLLGRISPESMDEFEKHYFECTCCFTRIAERDEVIKLLKRQDVFEERGEKAAEAPGRGSLPGRFFTSARFRRWAVIIAAAAVIALAVWLLVR